MECPQCGYDVDGSANFCPRCRHRFQESLDIEDWPPVPEHGQSVEKSASEPSPDQDPEKFSGKELQYLKVQLIQPSLLVIGGVAIAGYVSFPQLQTITVAFRETAVPAGGAICLFAGLVIGGIFYWGMSARLVRFRSI